MSEENTLANSLISRNRTHDTMNSLLDSFEILPQLLYYFGVDNEVGSLDWASIVVYACEASCEASLPYKHEFAWIQIYSPSTTL
ncbi:hypothetical protein glysoja_008966 [Glycine soja]|nr:hypothetical protein glysoja_008966 [Glycine soja]